MIVLAHRGASARERENTVAAFALARSLGADGVELDVRRSADGRLVVHHDPLPAGPVPDHVPTLVEALDTCGGLLVNVEIKNAEGEPDFDPDRRLALDVVALLAQRPGRDRVLVSSFDLATIDAVRAADPSVPTAWLVVGIAEDTLAVLVDHGHRVLHPWFGSVTEAVLAEAHRRGIELNVWTCDDPARIAELARWGIDGVCTNVPDVALRIRDEVARG
ncbi:MAG: glycerophosphodiester phosphodiesterase [Acidimicrobiales bacterium]